MRRFLLALLFFTAAAPAQAEIRVVDVTSGAVTVPAAGDGTTLQGFNDDGTALLVERGGRRWLPLAGGPLTDVSEPLMYAESIGPGGRTVRRHRDDLQLYSPDGRRLATRVSGHREYLFTIGWSRDGTKVAMAGNQRLVVFNADTGAILLSRKLGVDVTEQAFSPDGAALVASDERGVYRLDLATGHSETLYRGETYPEPQATWSSTGRIAITVRDAIKVIGAPGLHVAADGPALWSADGSTLAYRAAISQDCESSSDGVAVVVPGGTPRELVAPEAQELRKIAWSPVGAQLAIEVGKPYPPARRGRRHPWPKHVGHDFAMYTRKGDAAVRRVVVRVTRALRRGEAREAVVLQMHKDFAKVDKHFDGLGDTEVSEAVILELDPWFHAAGFAPIDSYEGVTC